MGYTSYDASLLYSAHYICASPYSYMMRYIIGLFLLVSWVACQPKAIETPLSGIDQLFKDYEMQPTPQSAGVFLDSLSSYLSTAFDKNVP